MRNFYGNAAIMSSRSGSMRGNRLLVTGPLYHVGAFDLPGMAVLWVGGMLCILRDFSAEAAVGRHRDGSGWTAPGWLRS